MAAGPVDWSLAERVGVRIAGTDALARSYHHDSVGPDVAELVPLAEQLVADVTGLRSANGGAQAAVVDRARHHQIEPGDVADLRLDGLPQGVAVEKPGGPNQREYGHAEQRRNRHPEAFHSLGHRQ